MTSTTGDSSTATSTGNAAGNAVTLANVSTCSVLDSGALLSLSGDLELAAAQVAVARSTAALVALTFARHEVLARSDRGLAVAGSVRIAATGSSVSSSRPRRCPAVRSSSPVTRSPSVRALVEAISRSFGMRGTGGVAVPSVATGPVRSVALTLALVDVGAELPDGVPASILGSLSLPAQSSASSTASAGAGAGSSGSTGPSAALNVATATVRATASRDADVRGDLLVRAGRGPPADERFSATVSTPGSFALNSVTRSTSTTAHGTTDVVVVPQKPAFSPPAGAVHISAALGGTVRLGAATLTFAPGALPADAWVLVTSTRRHVAGLITLSDAYDLFAFDAVTGEEIHTFLSAPRLTVAVGTGAADAGIWYVAPAGSAQEIDSSTSHGSVSADLPHFSTYVVATNDPDLLATIGAILADIAAGNPPTSLTFVKTGTYSVAGVLTVTDPTLTFANIGFTDDSGVKHYTGTVSISVPTATISGLASVTDLTATYALDGDVATGGDLTLTAQNLTVTLGTLASLNATSVTMSSTSDGTDPRAPPRRHRRHRPRGQCDRPADDADRRLARPAHPAHRQRATRRSRSSPPATCRSRASPAQA